MTKIYFIAVSIICSLLIACDTDLPSENASSDFNIDGGAAHGISDQEYQSLEPVEKYQVASKLAATIYKGIPVEDFFQLSSGLADSPETTEYGDNYIQSFRSQISADLDEDTLNEVRSNIEGLDENGNANEDLRKYSLVPVINLRKSLMPW